MKLDVLYVCVLMVLLQSCKTMTHLHYTTLTDDRWEIKSYEKPHGPGSNKWGGVSTVLQTGSKLEFQISSRDSGVYCSEVRTTKANYGQGLYSFHLEGKIDSLKDNSVFGIFLLEDKAVDPREIDIEFTKWAKPQNNMIHYSIHHFEKKTETRSEKSTLVDQQFSCFIYCMDDQVYLGTFPGRKTFSMTLLPQMRKYKLGANLASRYRVHINYWKLPKSLPKYEDQKISLLHFSYAPEVK